MLYFETSTFCTLDDVTQAVAAASYGAIPQLECKFTEDIDAGDVGMPEPFGGDGK